MKKLKPTKWALFLILGLWGAASLAVTSFLHSYHLVSFFPRTDLARTSRQSWSLTHVLSTDCRCSQEVMAYLIKRGARTDIVENVLLLGKDPLLTQKFIDKGFRIHSEDPSKILEEKALGVPFLMIGTPQEQVVYAGGYAKEKIQPGTALQDLQILDSLQGGRTPQDFPIFGCAVSLKYQQKMDPFGFKYKKGSLNDNATKVQPTD